MLDILVRFMKRTAILVPGLVVTYFVVTDLYPVIDSRVPAGVAILATYILTAYVFIPAILRLIRIFFRLKHTPLYSTTPDGFASDPVNIGLIGTRDEVIRAMEASGWHKSDKRTPLNLIRMITAVLLDKPYLTAPFSTLYLLGRSQDIGFQLPIGEDPSHRHHVRFWAVKHFAGDLPHEHLTFWHTYHPRSSSDRTLWVGAASMDIGIGFIRHNAQITHMIHPDTNAERELIVKHLKASKQVTNCRMVKIGDPYQLRNRVWSGYLKSDGQLAICELKTTKSKKA